MSNELVEIFKKQLGFMSYYNAAESEWKNEETARNECRRTLREIATNLRYQGIDPKPLAQGFLVSESDYK